MPGIARVGRRGRRQTPHPVPPTRGRIPAQEEHLASASGRAPLFSVLLGKNLAWLTLWIEWKQGDEGSRGHRQLQWS